ncbi:MAG: DUF3137 domain-containing protein [Micavibrio sp.]|nr:DUF3137 domain-containing protein [Micavibrio sp.]
MSKDDDHIEIDFENAVHPKAILPGEEPAGEIRRSDDHVFNERVDKLLEQAESMRLRAMLEQRNRGFIAMSAGLAAICLGAGGFGWYFFVEAQLIPALGFIMLAIAVAAGLNLWSEGSRDRYEEMYKSQFLPRLAKVLGNLKYFPTRGISPGVLPKTGVIPAHDHYHAEDCFMGTYKGVKVLFSEARLYTKEAPNDPVFSGLFVLLEKPTASFEGHTIITANLPMAKHYRDTRWKKLESVPLNQSIPHSDRFRVYSDMPAFAINLFDKRLIKELAEAADIFDKSHLTAVFFQKKYAFMAIPYKGDLFEASKIHVPVATKRAALQCKREIHKILEVIDILDIFSAHTNTPET